MNVIYVCILDCFFSLVSMTLQSDLGCIDREIGGK